VAVYAVEHQDRGVCSDSMPCSVLLDNCADGFECVFDEEHACANLSVVGCNDNDPGCDPPGPWMPEPERSALCVTDLVPGDPYYVMVAAKSRDNVDEQGRPLDLGFYTVQITSPCTNELPPLHNDVCTNAEQHTGGDTEPLVIPFDLSGQAYDEAPATFDCPSPPSWCTRDLVNDAWFEWTAPRTGVATFETCAGDETPDTGLVVYEGCSCPVDTPADDGRIRGCSEIQGIGCFGGSRVRARVSAGMCYQLRLGGGSTDRTPAGNLRITWELGFPDCNGNEVPDDEDIIRETSDDCQPDGIPDECQVPPIEPDGPDCNDNSTPDDCEDDSDDDGVIDECDGCPEDSQKIEPGVCGCGVVDDDTDGDGTEDCIDGCPNDPHKIEPGVCDCGVPDDDTDGDGTEDCIDGCPNDPHKVEPGVCGCGVPEDCEVPQALDIKPGSCPNPVNPKSKGVVPMAVVGSESFDVTQIDIDSLTVARADGVGGVVAPLTEQRGPRPGIADVATPFEGDRCACHEFGGDGIDDLTLKFSTPEMVETLELGSSPGETSVMLTLSGSLLDGSLFTASDCILIPGGGRAAGVGNGRGSK
jgi:hypothetical protein